MNNSDQNLPAWNFKKLFLGNLIVGLVVYFSIDQGFKTPWDEQIFFYLNGSLQEGRTLWNNYWAFTNSKIFDSLSGLFLVALCLWYILFNRAACFQERLSRVFLLVVAVILTMIIISCGFELYYHQSPSQVLIPFVNINDLVSWIEVKTGTRKSFPSDHAAISFISVIFMWRYFGTSYGILVSFFAVINASPRLVGGGHWFGDVAIGGVFLAFMVTIWLIYTPMLNVMRKAVHWIFAKEPLVSFSKSWN
ncbi:phosphatase PAP2 family protein [Kiloniella sp. EL199]|uniref:phosphatase PAP2 family protein n=1 Tax=Kiloniella sp. EL199 TaxID=2107581 RepID=UPI0013C53653|nr:phosphatase PAP2 family protein [Kiloniella sp. EL199]